MKKFKKKFGKPLTSIPDPFKKFNSFGNIIMKMLKQFLNKFKFKYILKVLLKTIKRDF